jgi:hypothetical protein
MKLGSILFMLAFGLTGCGPLCSERKGAEVTSPSGEHLAVLFQRNCGAATGFVYHLNLRGRSHSFSVNSTGTITDGEVFTTDGRPKIELAWKDDSHLDLVCLECDTDTIYKQKTSWNRITISYRTRK